MSRLIDADALAAHMFHGYGTEITPVDIDAETYKLGWNDAIEAIMYNAPTIEPEQRTGEWIDENNIPVGWHKVDKSSPAGSCKCSNCGEWLVASDEYFVKGNFCPNCGSYNGGKNEV